MAELPFNLQIRQLFPQVGSAETVTCAKLLRAIGGKREVYNAVWNGRPVIAKIFLKKISGWFHLKKEWYGLRRLQELGLSGPKPLFFGRTADSKLVTVVEKIQNSSTAINIFRKTTEREAKISLLSLVCKELAKQHGKGVEQKDLHLGNFLVSADKVFALDTAEIRFHKSALSRERSIAQLVLLAGYFPAEDKESVKKFSSAYFSERGWKFGDADFATLQKKTSKYKKHITEKWLKKSLRTNTRHLKIREPGCTAIFDRTFCGETKAKELIEQIDVLVDGGEILKRGNTCHLSTVIWNGKKIVIKRYNHKGILHSICQTVKGSRARKGWLCGLRLFLLDIATPKPLAFIERRKNLVLWNSYLVTEYVSGQKLPDFLESNETSKEAKAAVTKKIVEVLSNLGRNFISHGDLKHSNILVTGDEPVLTDLDGMLVHKFKWLGRYKAARDMEKFINGERRGRYDIRHFMETTKEGSAAK